MTPAEFRSSMEAITDEFIEMEYDPEAAHLYADKLICELLIELGYDDGVEVFRSMKKWYA